MRLINTTNGHFEEFIGTQIPKYAILSHTWEEEEVSYKDVIDGVHEHKKGFQKIAQTCKLAARDGIQYAWVDTCCIDKSSSAELTEAINSMFRWYQCSEVCYGFLSDLPAKVGLHGALQSCRWFTRGWTLQELIAPRSLHFYDQEWQHRGSKIYHKELLSKITSIGVGVLKGTVQLDNLSVAKKMSWAAHRKTTRLEDIAYCLLGLFDVHMPLLYGEGMKAFWRLQEEIVKSTADLSIFAWCTPRTSKLSADLDERVLSGILAKSPLDFAGCGSYSGQAYPNATDFSISSLGVKIRGQIDVMMSAGFPIRRYVLPVNCRPAGGGYLGVRLRKVGPELFARENPWSLLQFDALPSASVPTERYLLTKLHVANQPLHMIRMPSEFVMYGSWPRDRFDIEDQLFFITADPRGDIGSFKILVTVSFAHERKETHVELECMFYAIGWSDLESRNLQCTLIDHRARAVEIRELQSEVAELSHNRLAVLCELAHRQIPKVSAVALSIPGTQFSALVSFEPRLTDDPTVCRNKFWLIDFSYKVFKTENLPIIKQGKWMISSNMSRVG